MQNSISFSSKLLYSIVAIFFTFTLSSTIFLGTFGWAITDWDPLGWRVIENRLQIFIAPILFFLSSFVANLTLYLLFFKRNSDKLNIVLTASQISSFFSIIGIFSVPLTIVFPGNKNFGENSYKIPILSAYFGFFILIGVFGLYLALSDSKPKNDSELHTWKEYAAKTDIPFMKLLITYLGIFFMGFCFVTVPIIIINKFFPNPLTSYYFDDPEVYYIIGEAIIFFPGPFLHVITFLIYYWKPLKIKFSLFRLEQQFNVKKLKSSYEQYQDFHTKKIGTINKNNQSLLQSLEKDIDKKPLFPKLLFFIVVAQSAVILLFSGYSDNESWLIFIIIYSFWIWFFYFNILITSKLGKRFGLVKS